MGAVEITLTVPARAEHLALVRRVVAHLAAVGAGLPADRIEDLKLAVSEATTNAIEAYPPDEPSATVTVVCRAAPGTVEVEVVDRGKGFDPDAHEPPGPLDAPGRAALAGGLGIPLIERLVDRVRFDSAPGEGTTVTFVVSAGPAT